MQRRHQSSRRALHAHWQLCHRMPTSSTWATHRRRIGGARCPPTWWKRSMSGRQLATSFGQQARGHCCRSCPSLSLWTIGWLACAPMGRSRRIASARRLCCRLMRGMSIPTWRTPTSTIGALTPTSNTPTTLCRRVEKFHLEGTSLVCSWVPASLVLATLTLRTLQKGCEVSPIPGSLDRLIPALIELETPVKTMVLLTAQSEQAFGCPRLHP
mmetsp:Transcript_109346/g.273910  ORF Transcript_109346/g.273910 Transcript_109346/m.273910 type:complete len:213 (+) Transcript_109346:674-1312(+)